MANQKKMVEEITSMDTDFAKWYTDVVKKAELVYFVSSTAEYFIPYYKFYVEIEHDGTITQDLPGIKSYGAYYVPAIDSKYIIEE